MFCESWNGCGQKSLAVFRLANAIYIFEGKFYFHQTLINYETKCL